MKIYFDKFGNRAEIEKLETLPYNGETKKVPCFRLTLISTYDNDDFIYHISIHETLGDAENKMKNFSCGDWVNKINLKN